MFLHIFAAQNPYVVFNLNRTTFAIGESVELRAEVKGYIYTQVYVRKLNEDKGTELRYYQNDNTQAIHEISTVWDTRGYQEGDYYLSVVVTNVAGIEQDKIRYQVKLLKNEVSLTKLTLAVNNEQLNSYNFDEYDLYSFELYAEYSDGNIKDVKNDAKYSSSNSKVAFIDDNKVYSNEHGKAVLTASYQGISFSVTINVQSSIKLLKIDATSLNGTVPLGQTIEFNKVFNITAFYSDGSTKDITDLVAVQRTNNEVYSSINKKITGIRQGSESLSVGYRETEESEFIEVDLIINVVDSSIVTPPVSETAQYVMTAQPNISTTADSISLSNWKVTQTDDYCTVYVKKYGQDTAEITEKVLSQNDAYSYTANYLQDNTRYVVQIDAKDGTMLFRDENIMTKSSPIPQPVQYLLTAQPDISITSDSISLNNWKVTPTDDYCTVYIKRNGQDIAEITKQVLPENGAYSCTIDSLQEDTKYVVQIDAKDGTTLFRDENIMTKSSPIPQPVQYLLTAQPNISTTVDSISLNNWNVSPTGDYCTVYVKRNGQDIDEIAKQVFPVNGAYSCIIGDLQENTQYVVQIDAKDGTKLFRDENICTKPSQLPQTTALTIDDFDISALQMTYEVFVGMTEQFNGNLVTKNGIIDVVNIVITKDGMQLEDNEFRREGINSDQFNINNLPLFKADKYAEYGTYIGELWVKCIGDIQIPIKLCEFIIKVTPPTIHFDVIYNPSTDKVTISALLNENILDRRVFAYTYLGDETPKSFELTRNKNTNNYGTSILGDKFTRDREYSIEIVVDGYDIQGKNLNSRKPITVPTLNVINLKADKNMSSIKSNKARYSK